MTAHSLSAFASKLMSMRGRIGWLFLWAVAAVWGQGGPPGASVSDLAVAVDNPNVMFAATNAGFFVSRSGGQTWSKGNGGLPSVNVRQVAGNSTVQFVALRAEGVYRSRNDAAWEFAGEGLEGNDILSIEMSPMNPDVLYAGSATGQVFQSLNGGEGWVSVDQGLDEGIYIEISASPVDPDLLFALNFSGEEVRGRLFRTQNGGESWEEVLSGPVTVTGLAFAVDSPGVLWIATGGGLFVTTDSGDSFSGPFFATTSFQDVAISPTDSGVVYASISDSNVIRTNDGGQTWVTIVPGLPRARALRLEATERSVFAGLDGSGVFRSDDGGENWSISSAGMHGADVTALSVAPAAAGSILAATSGGGMFQTHSGGEIWQESRQGFAAFQVTALRRDPADAEQVYAATSNPFFAGDGSLFKSADGGQSWEALFAGRSVFDVAVHPDDGRILWAATSTDRFFGTAGLLQSRDGGRTFDEIRGDRGELSFLDVTDIAIDSLDPRRIYVIARNPFSFPVSYRFAWTEDAGEQWFGAGFTATPLTSVAVDPGDRRRIFVGSWSGVFLSADGGENFALSNNGLPADAVVTSIAFDRNDNNAVYIATSAGVFKSMTRGAGWVAVNSGLELFPVGRVAADSSAAGHLYAATVGAGVFKTVDGGANWTPTGGLAALSSAAIVNAATFQAGGVAPGGLVSLFVQNAGPETGVAATAFDPETGRLPTLLGDVRVFFDDIAAPLFFVRRDQLNVQAPFEVAGRESVAVRVEYKGASGGVVPVNVREADAGLFSPVLNQDSSLNSAANTAARGSVVQLFATGQGTVSPVQTTGAPGPSVAPFAMPDLPVTVWVDDSEADVLFAGLTPGLVGLMQLNVRLPANANGALTIRLRVGESESPTTAVVFVD